MPTYRFKTDAGPRSETMEVRQELASLRDAQFEAVRYLGELLRDDGLEFWLSESACLTVADTDGAELFTLRLSLV